MTSAAYDPDAYNEKFVTYTYTDGFLTDETSKEGIITHYTYYDDGSLHIKTLNYGGSLTRTYTYHYDDLGRIEKIVDTLGGYVAYQYDIDNLDADTSTPDHNVRKSVYASDDTLLSGQTVVYNSLNKPWKVIDGNGNTTTYTYNELGLVETVTTAENAVVTREYDDSARLESVTTTDGTTILSRTEYSFNALNRLEAETRILYEDDGTTVSASYTKSYTYDDNGNLETVTDENSKVTVLNYDEMDRLKTVTDPLNHVTEYFYDPASTVTEIKNPLEKSTTYTPDVLGMVAENEDPEGRLITFEYDDMYRIKYKRFVNPEDVSDFVEYEYLYNAFGQAATVTEAKGDINAVTHYFYDDRGNLDHIINAESEKVYFEYDAAGRLKKKTDADSTTVEYSYDTAGNRTLEKKRDDTWIHYTYDSMNRLTDVYYSATESNPANLAAADRVQHFAYDKLSRMTLAEEYEQGNGTTLLHSVTMTYDSLSRLKSEEQDSLDWKPVFHYNSRSLLSGIDYPNGKSLTRSSDDRGFLDTITYDDSPVAKYTWDGAC